MKFFETPLRGALLIDIEPIKDERGFFARTYCEREFQDHGIEHGFVQCNISHNKRKGTLRGLHYQAPPYEEEKLISCTRGSIYDVIVDIRPNSPTYKKWFSVNLTEKNGKMIYIPSGFAHGFQTLCDDCNVFYQMGNFFQGAASRGIHWSKNGLNINWPIENPIVSNRDNSFVSLDF